MIFASYESTGETLRNLLTVAWLLPLLGFAIEIFGGYLWDRRSKAASCLAVGCIFAGFLCSAAALVTWGRETHWAALKGEEHHAATEHAAVGAAHLSVFDDAADADHPRGKRTAQEHSKSGHLAAKTAFSGSYYTLAQFGALKVSLDYYIDSLTLVIFMIVTLISTC